MEMRTDLSRNHCYVDRMIVDHEHLMLYARWRREELLRTMERSRSLRPGDAAPARPRLAPPISRLVRPARRGA